MMYLQACAVNSLTKKCFVMFFYPFFAKTSVSFKRKYFFYVCVREKDNGNQPFPILRLLRRETDLRQLETKNHQLSFFSCVRCMYANKPFIMSDFEPGGDPQQVVCALRMAFKDHHSQFCRINTHCKAWNFNETHFSACFF